MLFLVTWSYGKPHFLEDLLKKHDLKQKFIIHNCRFLYTHSRWPSTGKQIEKVLENSMSSS